MRILNCNQHHPLHHSAKQAGQNATDEGAEEGDGEGGGDFFDGSCAKVDGRDIQHCFATAHNNASAPCYVAVGAVLGVYLTKQCHTATATKGTKYD